MSIVKKTVPYEILFRLKDDGSIQGCHKRDLKMVVDEDTGEILSAKELDPESLAGEAITQVLGVINLGLSQSLDQTIEEVILLSHEVDSLKTVVENKNKQLEELAAHRDQVENDKEGLGYEVLSLTKSLDALGETIKSLRETEEKYLKLKEKYPQEDKQLKALDEELEEKDARVK
jgi:predicted RNase H-like nuclease (RuvC/YqgF family)